MTESAIALVVRRCWPSIIEDASFEEIPLLAHPRHGRSKKEVALRKYDIVPEILELVQ